MGGGAKKKNESFSVSPAARVSVPPAAAMGLGGGFGGGLSGYVAWPPPSEVAIAAPETTPDPDIDDQVGDVEVAPVLNVSPEVSPAGGDVPDLVAAQRVATDGWGPLEADPASDPHGWHDELRERVSATEEALRDAGFDPEDPEVRRIVAAQANEELQKLDTDSLQRVAHAAGFEHPTLVGHGSSRNPLTFWANPAYEMDQRKEAVQAAANRRYEEIMAGGEYHGITKADLSASEAKITGRQPAPTQTSTLSSQEVQQLRDNVDSALGSRSSTGTPSPRESYSPEQIATIVDAYNTASQAVGGDAQADAELMKVRQDLRWRLTTANKDFEMDESTRQNFVNRYGIDEKDSEYAGASDLVTLARSDTRDTWQAATPTRHEWVRNWDEAHTHGQDRALISSSGVVALSSTVEDPSALASHVQGLERLRTAIGDTAERNRPSKDAPIMASRAGQVRHASRALNDTRNVNNTVEALNSAPLESLRTAAKSIGMEHSELANRAQLRGYLVGRAFGGRNPALTGDATKWEPEVIQKSLNQRAQQREVAKTRSNPNPKISSRVAKGPHIPLDHKVRKQGQSALSIVSARNMASSKDGSRYRFQYGPDSHTPSFMEFRENPETGNFSALSYRVNPSGSRTLITHEPDLPGDALSSFIVDSNAKTWLVEPGVPSTV